MSHSKEVGIVMLWSVGVNSTYEGRSKFVFTTVEVLRLLAGKAAGKSLVSSSEVAVFRC